MPDWAKEIRVAIAPLNLEPMQDAELVEELASISAIAMKRC